jgi:uncharacterized protein YdeI (YjbR/CyaY-like superfamily)
MHNPKLSFTNQEAWEAWLETHGEAVAGVWLRIAKRSAEQSTVSYAEAVESALCYGWIDGQKQAENEHYWLQRFTPRTAKSIWSKINTAKAEAKQDGRWKAAYSSAGTSTVPDDLQQALDANPKAKQFFATLNGQNRYAILFRIQNVKKAETRAKKITQFIDMLNKGEKLHP